MLVVVIAVMLNSRSGAQELPSQIRFTAGTVNTVLIENAGQQIAIYGADKARAANCAGVLLTHHRRDVVWRASELIQAGVTVYGPEAELPLLANVGEYWKKLSATRFHDYQCQSTKVLTQSINVTPVKSGSQLEIAGLTFDVVDTPGYTAGSVSYLVTLAGKKIALVGDLIYGDGQLVDLYSLQNGIEVASIRGYHGYAARLSSLVSSLKKVKALQPDLLIPARGPVISNPDAAIDKLIARVQAIYLNYLSTNALHWYFKEERMRQCAEAVMGGLVENLKLMPYSLHQQAPDWVFESATSRLLISDSGAGFLIDCGYQRVIDAVQKQIDSGVINKVEGIFVTHYHDDHTDMVQAAAEHFRCPVYCLPEYQDILANPHAYRMPAMTDQPIKELRVIPDQHQMEWHEFQFTFHFFPGQALYHGALLAERPNERPIFFIGDSFAPSGIDDYCLLNRNLLGENRGYKLCFRKLRELGKPVWLMNEHIAQVFQFSEAELDYLENRYHEREKLLAELFPWDSPNYGVDERWAEFYPYAASVGKNAKASVEVRLTNHSPSPRTFVVGASSLSPVLKFEQPEQSVVIPPGEVGKLTFELNAGGVAGIYPITASVRSDGMSFEDWIEAIVTVEP
jgi:glyoxylase-like metal-dependent hydrolase (beta-lactamase superfamily II)